jgi:hypothetical protein
LRQLASIAINSDRFEHEAMTFTINAKDVFYRGFMGHVHGFRDGSAQIRLSRRHDAQMTHGSNGANTATARSGAIENRIMFFL